LAAKTKGEPRIYRGSPRGVGQKVAAGGSIGGKFRMPNVKAQSSNKIQSPNAKLEKSFDIDSFRHSFGICLPARSRFGEGRDFDI
jgi:hypothetical protein